MPELPEVEVTRRGLLEQQLAGRTVVDLAGSGLRLRTEIPHHHLRAYIRDQQIRTIDRRAKYLLFRMESGAVLVIHLGMTGKLGLVRGDTARHKHDHLALLLDDGSELRFNDSRRFGLIAVWPAHKAAALEAALEDNVGIEPFGTKFTAEQLLHIARHSRAPVKSLLMNARLVAGIGNIYANEILFAAGVPPLLPANRLTVAQWRHIVEESRNILQAAIDAGGSTISDFLGASGHPGYFQLQLKVYGRKDAPCHICGGLIVKTTLAGRATYFCSICQPG